MCDSDEYRDDNDDDIMISIWKRDYTGRELSKDENIQGKNFMKRKNEKYIKWNIIYIISK